MAQSEERAVANLITVIGDKELSRITRNDALDFREWWVDQLMEDGLEIGTANKDLGHINKMWRTIDENRRLGLSPAFARLRIEGEETKQRAAYDVEFIRTRILAPGALHELNDEARDVVLVMVETGLRPAEIVNLDETTIALKHEVPHVQIRPNGRKLKTASSPRDMPLVGVSLEAMKRHPQGFPRYQDKAGSLSALVNKYPDNHGLRPTKRHTLYSLRHAFEAACRPRRRRRS